MFLPLHYRERRRGSFVLDILCTLIPGVAGLVFLNSVWLLLLKLKPKPSPAKQERLRQKQELLRRYPELRSTSETVVTGLGNYFIETVMFAIVIGIENFKSRHHKPVPGSANAASSRLEEVAG